VAYIIYVVYIMILKPFLFWKSYQKYSNVYCDTSFTPILGDLWYNLDNVKKGKVHYNHLIEKANEFKDYDLRVVNEGTMPMMFIVSQKAMSEFVELQPVKVDKAHVKMGLPKCAPQALANVRTNKLSQDRRKLMIGLLDLTRAAHYIPCILKNAENALKGLEDGKVQRLNHAIDMCTFGIISNVFFGDDVDNIANKLREYYNPDGTMEMIPVREMFVRLPRAFMLQQFNPLTTALPFLNTYNLVNPYKRDDDNLRRCRVALEEVLDETKDEKSIYHQIKNVEWYDKETLFAELTAFTVAAFESSAQSTTTVLYNLAKKPECLKKVRAELEENGFKIGADFGKICTMDSIQDLEYLGMVIKEAWRMDTPFAETFPYQAYEDIEICGVPVKKGTWIGVDLVTSHFDENCWLDPMEFVPERFDTESDFYNDGMKSGKKRNVYSTRTFSHGARMCPGQTLATLQIKIILAYLLTHMDYEVDKEFLERAGVGFGFGSEFDLMAKINKKV
jgi:cytochrome P450